jgi:hypothetical protein
MNRAGSLPRIATTLHVEIRAMTFEAQLRIPATYLRGGTDEG